RQDQPLLDRGILLLRDAIETFEFTGLASEPTLSLNRHFSAPVDLQYAQADVMNLMRYDDDGFVRFEAAQTFAASTLQEMMRGENVNSQFLESFGHILNDETLDLQFKAQLLSLPTVTMLMQLQTPIDVRPILEARENLNHAIAMRLKEPMRRLYRKLHRPQHEALDGVSMGERALKNRLLGYLMVRQDAKSIECALSQYRESLTMTDRIAALKLLESAAPEAAQAAMRDFYAAYSSDMLVMTKYFSVIAASPRPGVLERVKAAMEDPAFDIKVPNLVRALIGAFARNPHHFHAHDGSGYDFIGEQIIALDAINPMIAAGLAGAFKTYNRMNDRSRGQMQHSLERVMAHEGISKNVYEIVEKILAG
ncbi:MAG TPA: DUF3458 domain-containing protein, partial [Sulfuricurvum sp.]|nr:DUF3458 domain-containing protein [Sulfuricurvum sp.]